MEGRDVHLWLSRQWKYWRFLLEEFSGLEKPHGCVEVCLALNRILPSLRRKGQRCSGKTKSWITWELVLQKEFWFFFFDHLKYICWKRNLLKRWPQIVIPREAVCWHWEFASLLKKKFKLRNVIYLHNASDLYLVVCLWVFFLFVCFVLSLKNAWKEIDNPGEHSR